MTAPTCSYQGPDWDNLPIIPDGITVSTVTEGCVEGTGIYDVFMQSHRDAIHQEYIKNRIKGSEYSKVYLGGMQQAMQSAVAFALNKDEAAAKAELARYAIVKTQAETELVGHQICKVEKEIELLQAQRELLAAQTWAEIAKVTPDIQAHMQQLLGLGAGDNGQPVYVGPNTIHADSIIGAQVTKTINEQDLLQQKKETELAQVSDVLSDSAPVKGEMLKQKNLLQRQADGFIRDAEAKVAKIAADAFSVQYSTVDGDITGSGFDINSLWGMVTHASNNTDDAKHTDEEITDK